MRRRCLTVLAAALLLLSACGPGGGNGTANIPKSANFVMGMAGVPNGLDVAPFSATGTRGVLYAMQSNLWSYNTAQLKNGSGCDQVANTSDVLGVLVQSWQVSSDRKTITGTLKNYRSQYGNPLTAADVQWSIQREVALLPSIDGAILFNFSHYLKPDPVTIVNDRTFKLSTTSPSAVDLLGFASATLTVVDSTEARKHATPSDPWATQWLSKNMANFGPWKLESFDPGNQAAFVPNPGYTASRGNVTHLVMKQVPDASTRFELLQSGNLDWASGLTYSEYASLKSSNQVKVYSCVSPTRDVLVLNQADPHFANTQVRQAISEGLDRSALVKGAFSGFGTPASFGLPSAYLASTSGAKKLTENVSHAKQLLASAGYPNGFDFTLTYSDSNPGSEADQLAVLVKSQLARIGVTVNLQNVASATDYSSQYFAGKYQAAFYGESPGVYDPYWTTSVWTPGSANNSFHWNDPAFVNLVQQVGSTPNGSARNGLITQLNNTMVDDHAVVPLAEVPFVFAARGNTSGYKHPYYASIWPTDVVKSNGA